MYVPRAMGSFHNLIYLLLIRSYNMMLEKIKTTYFMNIYFVGESPSSSASDIDNLNNSANGDKAAQAKNSGSPQLAANLVIAGRNRPNFSRLLSFVSLPSPMWIILTCIDVYTYAHLDRCSYIRLIIIMDTKILPLTSLQERSHL